MECYRALKQHAAQVLTALAAEQPALLEWHLGRNKRALALCIAQIGRDPDDGFDDVEVRFLVACSSVHPVHRKVGMCTECMVQQVMQMCHLICMLVSCDGLSIVVSETGAPLHSSLNFQCRAMSGCDPASFLRRLLAAAWSTPPTTRRCTVTSRTWSRCRATAGGPTRGTRATRSTSPASGRAAASSTQTCLTTEGALAGRGGPGLRVHCALW